MAKVPVYILPPNHQLPGHPEALFWRPDIFLTSSDQTQFFEGLAENGHSLGDFLQGPDIFLGMTGRDQAYSWEWLEEIGNNLQRCNIFLGMND